MEQDMSVIDFGKSVSLAQAAAIILATPQNRYLLRGEPGIGKSSILKILGAARPEYNTAYMDVPNMDLGDVAMPVIDHENKVTRYYPNARFRLHEGKPVIIMLDEFTKGAEPIKNMLHPLLEVANPRLGDISIDTNSVIFLTGNLGTDGVGDSLKAHTQNRIIPLTIRKPTAEEWLDWAANNNIDGIIMAWVDRFKHCMASYTDSDYDAANNPYVYNPRKPQGAFVSPRSLERASNIVKVRNQIDAETMINALTGALGESASRDLAAFIDYKDQLPTMASIVADPRNAQLPTSVGAYAVMVFSAVTSITAETLTPFMTYLERAPVEWQSTFCITLTKNKTKQRLAYSNAKFGEWMIRNEDVL
jgi:hypothetical protein